MDSDLKDKNISPSNKPDKNRQLWLLDNHPIFTGICSNCGYNYGNLKVLDVDKKSSHWNCPECNMSYK